MLSSGREDQIEAKSPGEKNTAACVSDFPQVMPHLVCQFYKVHFDIWYGKFVKYSNSVQ